MKKTIATLLMGAWLISSASQADSKIVYSANPNEEVKGSTQFPGYGSVPSNLVCVTPDKQTFRTLVPEETKEVCVESHIDHSESTRPVVVCTKYETVHTPARILETPVTTTQEGCVRSHVDHSDSTHPKVICDETGLVQVSQSLTYDVYTYAPSDYMHRDPTIRTFAIATCP